MTSTLILKNSSFVSSSIKSKLDLVEKLMEEVNLTLLEAGIQEYSKVLEREVKGLKDLETEIFKSLELLADPDEIRKQRLAEEKAENPKLYDIERKVELEQGERMIMLRKKAGMTQKDLGHALGLSQSEISKYEAGQRSFDIQFIESVSAALKVSPQEFIGL